VRGNLPGTLSSFVGREQQLADLRQLFDTTRLLTLVGPGGIGKTRLALQLAGEMERPDGVWLVELAPLADPALVPVALAQVVGVPEQPARPPASWLVDALARRQLVVVLDNCEHLVQACADLVHLLLAACPDLCIVATSREQLRVPGEQVWHVPPLSVALGDCAACTSDVTPEAVRLFVERARSVQPGFALDEDGLSVVADICRRLDGIPLAIELAAANVATLHVRQIADRLDQRFRLLMGGYRTASSRQRTLLATVEWSFNLLSAAEQRLLAHLCVFAGSWTLEAAQAVCTSEEAPAEELLTLLGQLVSKSLLLVPNVSPESPRYALLETIRAFGLERLEATDALRGARARHAEFFLRFAEEVGERAASGEHRSRELERLEREHDNFREALSWTLETDADGQTSLRWAAALGPFWIMRGYFAELHSWLARLPARAGPHATWYWTRGVSFTRGLLALQEGRFAEARAYLEEALASARRVGDQPTVNRTLGNLGRLLCSVGDYAGAAAVLAEGLTSSRQAGDRLREAIALIHSGTLAYALGDYAAARAYCDGSSTIGTESDDAFMAIEALSLGGDIARAQGEPGVALRHYEAALDLTPEFNNRRAQPQLLVGLGMAALDAGDQERAHTVLLEGLRLSRELGLRLEQLRGLEALAGWAASVGQPELALRLASAAASCREHAGTPRFPTEERLLRRALGPAYRALGASATVELEHGCRTPLESVVTIALAIEPVRGRPSTEPPQPAIRLTPREREVAELVAQGLTNRQIAASLVFTEATAAKHVEHVLDKLGLASRVEIATWVVAGGAGT
jgi:predicted ATPase/DNA-binding CsgD family transcriptional regulator/tetratricopeptide (TPR) repeat protein